MLGKIKGVKPLASPGYCLDFEKPLVELERQIEEIKKFAAEKNIDMSEEIRRLQEKADQIKQEIYSNLTTWQRIQIARHPKRPTLLDYVGMIFTDFTELHGDRLFRDDPAMVGGLAYLDGRPVTVIGQQKGRDTKENLQRNFGMPHPEGYRKALRLMEQAAKFGRPIISLVDVVGAYPGIEAEERGQGEAVARGIREMAALGTPIVVVITGEGGSGGALAIGVGDRILMLENAYYSVISPEGCASILWKDASRAPEAAEALRLTGKDLMEFGIVDEVIREPMGGAHKDPKAMAETLKEALIRNLLPLLDQDKEALLTARYDKFRKMGAFIEG
ncbi:MAG TPA: acetyl-CoA carboxylase carboxyltransferase subunit alpha [Firmicutes bacterium]|nr:acetyl-CoA carboxylase carboxyltransferase subunit alpha [Bacillota bacterium]